MVEHDARHVPGYDLAGSDLTGRAVFTKGAERLEVYTANRRSLEHVFGVDLIYLNATRQNIVMLQYKMLERSRKGGGEDWIYRPDDQLESEFERMKRFQGEATPDEYEYRLNPQVFYLRFAKRDAALKNAGITMPIDHFERLRDDPKSRGSRGGFRISFESLSGRYLRQTAFGRSRSVRIYRGTCRDDKTPGGTCKIGGPGREVGYRGCTVSNGC